MKKIFTLLSLFLLMAGMAPSVAQELTGEDLVKSYLQNGGIFRIYSNRSTAAGRAVAETASHTLIAQAASSSRNLSELWIVERYSAGYSIRNVNTGRYVQNQTELSKTHTTDAAPATFYIKYSDNNADGSEFVTISNASDYSGNTCWHQDNSNRVVIWSASEEASDWRLVPATDITEEEVLEHLNSAKGYASVENGKYYRLISVPYNRAMTEIIANNSLRGVDVDAEDYLQVWKLTGTSGTGYYIENAVTKHQVRRNTGGYSTLYTASASGGTFQIRQTNDKWIYNYTINDPSGSGYGLHCAETQSYNIVKWYSSAEANVWGFVPVEVDESKLAAAQEEYNTFNEMKENATTYTTELAKFFTDGACTELQDEYKNLSDEALRTAMEALPVAIQDMALKVKNGSWTTYAEGWDKTEQTYRIADYKAYSDFQRWADITGMSNAFGRLTNPTGVRTDAGDILQIYVGEIPARQSVSLEIAAETQAAGTVYALRQGFNVIKAGEAGHVFVFYNVDNTTNGRTPYTDIDSYAPVTVHIEGGTVCGYFDQTKGYTDEDWSLLQQHVFNGPTIILKSDYHVYNLNRQRLIAACPTYINGMMDCWNRIAHMENETMGLYEDFAGKFNNTFSITSIYTNYMYASTYGTYYEVNTMPSVFSYENMLTSAGSLWGPAHEQGHNHQKLINMIGCTEVSNNVWSNIAVYEQGRSTSRAASIKQTLDEFNAGKAWLDRVYDNSKSSGQADLWECTHLYWQLYQFFHIQGFNPNFYPELIRAMRRSPMNRSANTFVSATNDYLKFYITCCQASGYDLTEFFDAYGFFKIPELTSVSLNGTTRKAHHVSDYSEFYVTVTQSEIDNAKNRVKAMNLKPCNAIFIEDRIKAPAATYEGATPIAKKVAFSNEYPIGSSNGQLGQYTDYHAEDQFADYEYYYTISTARRVSINTFGKGGAVGFKVYDNEGKLVGLYNIRSFILPADLVEAGFTIKAAEGNGTDRIVYTKEEIETAIENVKAAENGKSSLIYDLQGRRVSTPQKGGVYVKGGKKVVF